MNPDDMTLRDIRRWYADNHVPYIEEDWGPRDEDGESAGQQTQDREREGRHGVRSTASTPDRMWWWEKKHFPWSARSSEEKRWVYALDAFFAPYLAMLSRPKLNLVQQVFNDRTTFQEVADEGRITRQSAHEGTRRAIRDLTRLIADDDPLFHAPTDGRRRDYAEEARAARRVLVTYLATQDITLSPEEE